MPAELTQPQVLTIALAAVVAVSVFGPLIAGMRFYKKVSQGQAVVRTGLGGVQVSTSGIFVFPIVHRAETVDLTINRVEVGCEGESALVLRDGTRADAVISIYLCIEAKNESILHVVRAMGTQRIGDESQVADFFRDPFSLAVATVAHAYTLDELNESREEFCNAIKKRILQTGLAGYELHTVAIRHLKRSATGHVNGRAPAAST